MRVFVTGATGFIGRALTAELLAHGHQVVGLARSSASAAVLRSTGAQPLQGSVRDIQSLRRGAATPTAWSISPSPSRPWTCGSDAWRAPSSADRRRG